MKKSGYYISAITVSIIALNASTSHALIPTVDVSAIAEGIKSNIELVKQSKIVVDATKLAGEVSSTLGEVKASISELALDELAKAKDFIEEQKKNLEEAKQDYEDYKKELDDAKAELEEGKKLLEDAKQKAEGAISDAKDAYNDAKDKYDDAKSKVDGFVEDATNAYNDAKSKVDGFVEDVTDVYNDAKGYYDEAKGYYDEAKGYYDTAKGYYTEGKDKLNGALETAEGIYNTVNDTVNGGSSNSGGTRSASAPTPTYSPETTPADLETALEQIDALKEEIERLKAEQNTSSEGYVPSTETEETPAPQDLEEALEEIQRLKEELAKYTGEETAPTTDTEINVTVQNPLPLTSSGLDGASLTVEEELPTITEFPAEEENSPITNSTPLSEETTSTINIIPIDEKPAINNIPQTGKNPSTENSISLPKVTTEEESSTPELMPIPSTSLPKAKGFRQRPTIENTTLYDINASAEDLIEEKYAYSAEISERLNFAQVDAVTGNAPTGNNDATGEFIISKKLAQYCEININDTTVDALEDCVKKVITYRSSSDMKTAEKADALIDEIFYENAVGTSAAAMVAHNQASHYKEEVLIPMKQDSSAGQADIRDDIAVMTAAQEQIQNLLIDLTKAYAAQIYQQSMKDSLQMRLKDVDPDAALAEQNSSGE